MSEAIDYEKVVEHRYEMTARDLLNKNGHEEMVRILVDLMMKVDSRGFEQ